MVSVNENEINKDTERVEETETRERGGEQVKEYGPDIVVNCQEMKF